MAVHHPASRVKEVSIILCGLLSDYMHVAKQFSKNFEKAQDQSGFISDWDIGCSVMHFLPYVPLVTFREGG